MRTLNSISNANSLNFNNTTMPKMRKVLSSLRENHKYDQNHKYISDHPYNQKQSHDRRFNTLASLTSASKKNNGDYQGFKMNTTDTQSTFSPP